MAPRELGDLSEARTFDKRVSTLDNVIRGRAMIAGGAEFPCRVRSISITTVELITGARVKTGQVVVCSLDYIGIIPGKIESLTAQGFVFSPQIPEDRRGRVAARIEWHSKRSAQHAEMRGAPRIVPKHREVEVRLGETIVLRGMIQNISMSGAAIDLGTDALPYVGTRVRVGARFATVVRLIPHGIAVQFIEPFTAKSFTETVRP